MRRYHAAHPEKKRASVAKWRRLHPETAKARGRLARYGLSPEGFTALFVEQEGKCAICDLVRGDLCVDHCHATGRVRGLLCRECNVAIGFLKENHAVMLSAARYILNANIHL